MAVNTWQCDSLKDEAQARHPQLRGCHARKGGRGEGGDRE